jgi:hypothetical protein
VESKERTMEPTGHQAIPTTLVLGPMLGIVVLAWGIHNKSSTVSSKWKSAFAGMSSKFQTLQHSLNDLFKDCLSYN